MQLYQWNKTKRREDQRMDLITELARRQDQLLRLRKPDLEALERLADDYDAAGLPWIAARLASRLEWLRVATFYSGEQQVEARD